MWNNRNVALKFLNYARVLLCPPIFVCVGLIFKKTLNFFYTEKMKRNFFNLCPPLSFLYEIVLVSGFAVLFTFVWHVTFFSGCMVLSAYREQQNRHAILCIKVKPKSQCGKFKKFLNLKSKAITRP